MFTPSKKKLCQNWTLYVITDFDAIDPRSVEAVVEKALDGGADIIQLRNKKASDEELVWLGKRLLAITRLKNVPLIINDRVKVAKHINADGVHLGQEDETFLNARRVLGADVIIGCSTHSREQALAAEKEGFDYIGVGPVFKTPTKPMAEPVGLDLVRFAAENISIPFVAIGGINETNIVDVRRAGAKTVAVVRALMGVKDPKQAAQKLKEKMTA